MSTKIGLLAVVSLVLGMLAGGLTAQPTFVYPPSPAQSAPADLVADPSSTTPKQSTPAESPRRASVSTSVEGEKGKGKGAEKRTQNGNGRGRLSK